MKNNKIIAIVLIICVFLVIVGVTIAMKSNNTSAFQSEDEMSKIINGTWRTGNTEFDFILTIDGDYAEIGMDGKDGEPALIVLVPDDGYFYFEKDGDTQESRYNVVNENGVYVIDNGSWIYRKDG
ncbi:MAG: hypothetical protein J1E83_13655 [Lachnospiraceae bacterium]|nr:hypothetical protein [Lachnospiraceae bacterium]